MYNETSHFTTNAEVEFGFNFAGVFVTATYEVEAECGSENPVVEGYSSWVEHAETDAHTVHAWDEDGEEVAVPVSAHAEAVRWADENLFDGFTAEGEWENWVTETAGV
ncbi:MAG: hypothetical protein CMF45_08845 [Legionellales bacterium]|nr:hypothetical protein [Legionellales bacterium]